MSTNTSESLQQIQAAFASITTSTHCSGSFPLDPATSKFFYARNGAAEVIDFTNTTEAQLIELAETCQPATFGLKDKDVLDESYRKAGKLDPTEFSAQSSSLTTGVIETIKETLLRGRLDGTGKALHVELYKLNVYGPGSFFKAHVDTPRSETMFGSLVIVLPTAHEGGSLILRHEGKETIFDTAHAVNSDPNASRAAFVAFFSDVEHEVALVTSGYRVTLTYNLYLIDSITKTPGLGPELDPTSPERIETLQKLLTNLLNDPTFLPDGGFLGFGLSHKYPFNSSSSPPSSDLSQLATLLKGSDAEVKQICEALGLNVLIKALYTEGQPAHANPCCLLDHFFKFGGQEVESELLEYIVDTEEYMQRQRTGGRTRQTARKGQSSSSRSAQTLSQALPPPSTKPEPIVVYPHGMKFKYQDDFAKMHGKPIVWLREFTKTNSFNEAYLHHGNEASIETAYGDVCLVVEVQKAEDRRKAQ